MKTKKHAERLVDRRADYAEAKQTRDYNRRATALLASKPELKTIGNARHEVIKADTEAAKVAYAAEKAARSQEGA